MIQKFKQYFYSIIIIGGVTIGCICTGSWLPFFIVFGIFSLVGIIIGIGHLFLNKKSDKINIRILDKGIHYVSDERFEQHNENETFH